MSALTAGQKRRREGRDTEERKAPKNSFVVVKDFLYCIDKKKNKAFCMMSFKK